MREMILNHASVRCSGVTRTNISKWLKDVVDGMGWLIRENVVQNHLRTAHSLQDTFCSPDYSLFSACESLRKEGHRDQHLFFMRLATKAPLLSGVREDVKDRFLGCEIENLSAVDGEPLVLCAITDGIAIGLPSDPVWDDDSVKISFRELLPNATIVQVYEVIDQLTRSIHAVSICERNRIQLLDDIDPRGFWSNRQAIFPNLIFAPGVENNLRDSATHFHTIVRKLSKLNESAREWQEIEDPVPRWKIKVTPESERVMNDPGLRRHREFQSHVGTSRLFEWHARYGSGGRIHLRFDSDSREVEIGYIGPHLPLASG